VLNAANEVAVHAFLAGRLTSSASRGDRAALERVPAARVHSFETLYRADAERAGWRPSRSRRAARELAARLPRLRRLIVLHELGPLRRRQGVGMRVERFALFFPPLLARVRRGETEYAIGAGAAGRLREDHRHEPGGGDPAGAAHRAYFRQPVWKRPCGIALGPPVNIVLRS
jgi:hypothetical protein